MTPAARLQAAIEILDQVIASAHDDGPPADVLVTRYFKTRRYAGSGDRRAVRELVFRAIRRSGERPASGRAAMMTGPETWRCSRVFGTARPCRPWSHEQCSPQRVAAEFEAASRDGRTNRGPARSNARLGPRVNVARGSDDLMARFPGHPTRQPVGGLGFRPIPDRRPTGVRRRPVEVRTKATADAWRASRRRAALLDLCGVGGRRSRCGGPPGAGSPPTHRSRCQSSLRGSKSGRGIETRLLNTRRAGRWPTGGADSLVDAPCSGSGTWRRNPEGRWRLTLDRLERLVRVQSQLLEIAAALVRPGGSLVYAVCSILAAEGDRQVAAFLARRSSWVAQPMTIDAGRPSGAGRLLVPGQDGTDGFFVARLGRPC